MDIILQNYNDLLKKIIFDTFSNNLKEQLNKLDSNGNVMNYINLLSNLDESLCKIAKDTLITTFEALDKSYSNSIDRKRKYDIKSHHCRTILTIFGEITFTRTFYKSKLDNKLYCYVDRLLGLHKYDYFDPYLKALIVDYASNNSYPKVAKYINDLIGNRIKTEDSFKYISRQTVRNIIMSSILSDEIPKHADTPEVLYIIADEKWIHTQNNNNKDVMEKSIVIFEGIKNHKLQNKRIFSSLDYSFLHKAIDYIYNVYDIDKLKTIYLMGDGAGWIKNLRHEFNFTSNINVIYALDKFHFKQALHHICLNPDLEKIIQTYILNDDKESFNQVCNLLIESYPYRKDTISSKQEYILNNWLYINNLYKYNLSCPMESQISHNLADIFTSRPKAYSIKTIIKLTELRLLFKNRLNIKQLYLNNFNSNEILTFNTNPLNLDIFDSYKQFIPYYKGKLYNPSYQYFY